MTRRHRHRPCWVVVAAVSHGEMQRAIDQVYRRDPEDGGDDTVEIHQGAAHLAIVEWSAEAGGWQSEFAKVLSMRSASPVYALDTCEDDGSLNDVVAYEGGVEVGAVRVWPPQMLGQLGFTFRGAGKPGEPVDLAIDRYPKVNEGDRRIGRWTVAQWLHAMKGLGWDNLVEEEDRGDAIAALADPQSEARLVACRFLGALGSIRLSLPEVVARLRALADQDPDPAVRSAAAEAASDLS
jgi:hypothetical protein